MLPEGIAQPDRKPMPDRPSLLHNAHVAAMREAMREYLEADEAARPHAAHVEERHDHLANTPADTPTAHPQRDYTDAIRKSNAAQDSDLSDRDIGRINHALIEYHAGREEEPPQALREARKSAPACLSKTARALTEAAAALTAIAQNPYALSALLAAATTNPQSIVDADENVERLAQMFATVSQLTALAERAQGQEFSDGLPVFREGAQPAACLDLLLLRLQSIFDGLETPYGEGEMGNATLAKDIAEVLAIANVKTRKGTPYSTKTIENRLAPVRDISKNQDLDTPAN